MRRACRALSCGAGVSPAALPIVVSAKPAGGTPAPLRSRALYRFTAVTFFHQDWRKKMCAGGEKIQINMYNSSRTI